MIEPVLRGMPGDQAIRPVLVLVERPRLPRLAPVGFEDDRRGRGTGQSPADRAGPVKWPPITLRGWAGLDPEAAVASVPGRGYAGRRHHHRSTDPGGTTMKPNRRTFLGTALGVGGSVAA